MATYPTPLNTSSHPYPPPRADTIPASLMPGQTPSGYPAQDQTPTFSRPSPTDKTQAVLPRRSPSMSARAQREMMQRETYYEERGIAMPGLPHSGPSAAGDSYSQGHGRKPSSEQRSGGRTYLQRPARPQDDARLYNIDLERQTGRSRMDPSDGLMYPSDSSHGSKTRSPSPDTSRLHAQQSHRLDQPADLSRGESLSRRVSKRLSVLPWSGPAQHAPLSMEDEKRLEEERLERELEEKQLDEEEKEMLKKGLFNWSEMKSWRFWIRKEWWKWYLILIVCGVVAALFTIYHDQIVDWLTPYAKKLKELPGGWAIPIGLLFVLSFPPLFGAEVVCLLCGLVWGLWIGFAIVAAGTFVGEMGNFFAFKYTLRGTAEKLERKNMTYALMAHVIREGGFKVAMIARFSAIPGHFLTAIFSTCGMSVISFTIGTILSLPKQLAIVYLGVALGSSNKDNKTDTIVSYVVLGITALVTVGAMWYIYRQMNNAKLTVWRARRAALANKGVDLSTLPKEPIDKDRPISRPILLTKTSLDESADPILPGAQGPAYVEPFDNTGYNYGTGPSRSTLNINTTPDMKEVDMASFPMQRMASRNGSQNHFPEPKPHSTINRQPSAMSTYTVASLTPGYLDPPPTQFPEPKPATKYAPMRRQDTGVSSRSSEDSNANQPVGGRPSRHGRGASLADRGVSRI